MVLWVLSFVDVQIIFEEKLIALAAFGVLYGVGIGIPYRIGFSYGGDDTVAKILKKTIWKSTELKKIYSFEEVIILLFMTLAFSLDQLAYAFAGQLIYVNSMNYVVFNLGPKLYDVTVERRCVEDRGFRHQHYTQKCDHLPRRHGRLLKGVQGPDELRVQFQGVRAAPGVYQGGKLRLLYQGHSPDSRIWEQP